MIIIQIVHEAYYRAFIVLIFFQEMVVVILGYEEKECGVANLLISSGVRNDTTSKRRISAETNGARNSIRLLDLDAVKRLLPPYPFIIKIMKMCQFAK